MGRLGLRLLRHGEQVLARDLPDELGMVAVDVVLRSREQLVVGLTTDDASAFTVDQLCHRSSSSVDSPSRSLQRRPCRNLAATLETRIQLCGRLTVELEGTRVESALSGRQGRLLFAYLCTNRLRAIPRDELVDALWPEEAPPAADTGLIALLSRLRRVLGADRLEGRSAIQ